jgi:type VII secretion protein EccE
MHANVAAGRPIRRSGPNSATRAPLSALLLPVRAGQVAVWQTAAIAAVLALPVDPTGLVVLALAVIAVAATSVRIGGRCAYQWAVILVGYLRRTARSAPVAATPLRALLPELHVHTHVDRAGNHVGLASVGGELAYSAVLRVAPAAHPDPRTLVRLLREAFDRTDILLAGAQLVVWTVPGLPQHAGTAPAPPIRVHWLTLRYRMSAMPSAALARGGGPTGAMRATSAAALRLSGDLAKAGCPSTVLDTVELHQELLAALGADPEARHGAGPAARYRAAEAWQFWSIGRMRQACFVPAPGTDPTAVLGRCVPWAAFTCTSHTLDRTTPGAVRSRTAVRIAVPPSRLWSWLTPAQVSTALGVGVHPAAGRQTEQVRSTMPLAL